MPSITNELWLTIPDFSKYKASNFGNIYSTITKKILTPSLCKTTGHLRVSVMHDDTKTRRGYLVSSLIAKTWLGEKSPGYVIAHLDKNCANNASNNLIYLEFCVHNKNFQTSKLKRLTDEQRQAFIHREFSQDLLKFLGITKTTYYRWKKNKL